MALYELDEFKGPQLLGFVRAIDPPQVYRGNTWLPTRTINDLAFQYIKGANSKPVMAHIMGWDSEAPIAGREPLGETIEGELPPIKRKAKFSEKEIIRFMQPRAGSTDVQDAINSVYAQTAGLVQSILARIEWLQLKALSEDTVVYDEGGVTFSFDFGLTDTYQLNLVTEQDGNGDSIAGDVSTAWTDTANSEPVADLTYICDKIQDEKGVRPDRMVLPRKYVGLLLQNDSIRTLIRGSSAPSAVLTRQELDTLFDLYGLPTLETYDVTLRAEQADGTYSEVRPLAAGKSFLLPPSGAADIGETLLGPTAESRALLGTPLAASAPGIYAATYAKDEPPSEWVKAVATAFPSLPGAEYIAQMTLGSS